MFGLNDFLLGGAVPMAAAMVAFAVAWLAARQAGVAWSAGVLVGFATGVVALEARNSDFASAALRLVKPRESHEWLSLLGLLAILPALAGVSLGRFRVLRLALAAALVAATPLWLLRGGKYLPSQQVRDAGIVVESAWSIGDAALIVGTLAAAALAAWWLWEATESNHSPRVRSLLVTMALIAAAATAGLTSSFTYAQLMGALAAASGGAAAAAWLLGVKTGPEAAAGPLLVIAGGTLVLAMFYSSMRSWQAAGLWVGLAFAAGWLPGVSRLRPLAAHALRCVACAIPLGLVLWQAGADFAESQRQQQEAAESNPYLNL